MDVNSLCALLQTKLSGGPLSTMIMQSRNKPMHILGMLGAAICLMVIVTVIISTVMFMRNKKSNRILPNRRIRRRKQPPLSSPFKPQEPDRAEEVEREPERENVNYNNNVGNVVRIWPPPPRPAPRHSPRPPSHLLQGQTVDCTHRVRQRGA
ncbi:hypothetical protein WMY93_018528 [Mugilogobius chulae]|uniref:Uncharacterized protein n=1 Tax=Mugilogobius chulae TaxID=88201 RepID=A0AAW0NND7_9GOBI